MKSVMKRWALLVALVVMSFAGGYAQEPSQVENTVDAIVKKYDGIDKVQCVKVAKGSGLKLLKMMLKREFGKEFMQGVTSITIINYSEASQETCQAIRQELDVFASMSEEFNVGEDERFSDSEHARCFVSILPDAEIISDFIIAMEDREMKVVMHMAGEIKL